MFTKNNNVYVLGDNFGDEYKSIPIEDAKKYKQLITLQLPYGESSFSTPIYEIEELNVENIKVVNLTFKNTRGNIWQVQCVPQSTEIFCKFSKFKNLNTILYYDNTSNLDTNKQLQHSNFATLDIWGFPCNLIEAKEVDYSGPVYNIYTKDAPSLIIGGICFKSKDLNKTDNESQAI